MLHMVAYGMEVTENEVFLSCWNVSRQMHLTEKETGSWYGG